VCGNPACTDLGGGRSVTTVPTALRSYAEIEAQTEEGGDSRGGGSAGKTTPKADRKPPKVISPSDPSSAWTAKANKRVQFGYGLNYLIDVEHAIIVDVEATPARTFDEVAATETMIERTKRRFDLKPKRLAADTAYGTGKFLAFVVSAGITPHIPVWDKSTLAYGSGPPLGRKRCAVAGLRAAR
jgi:hypothetical protein